MRGPIALLKHFVRNMRNADSISRKLWSAYASSRRFGSDGGLDSPKQPVVAESAATPNHGHRSRQAAAHVEREEFFHVLDLASAGLLAELLIGFEDLANAGRAHGMTVANQTAASVHRNLEWRLRFFRAHLWQRRRATLHKFDAFARLGEPENFVSDNFSNGKAIVHLGALQIVRRKVCHAKGFLRRLSCGRERWSIFLVERQIISRVTVPEQSSSAISIAANLVQILSRNQNNRCRAVGDLGTIGNFERRRDARILIGDLR